MSKSSLERPAKLSNFSSIASWETKELSPKIWTNFTPSSRNAFPTSGLIRSSTMLPSSAKMMDMAVKPRYDGGCAARFPENPMLTLHHLNDSRSQRILWLLEELGTPYELKRYQRDATTRLAPPELTAVHPLGKSPVITDGEIENRGIRRHRRLHPSALRQGRDDAPAWKRRV